MKLLKIEVFLVNEHVIYLPSVLKTDREMNELHLPIFKAI